MSPKKIHKLKHYKGKLLTFCGMPYSKEGTKAYWRLVTCKGCLRRLFRQMNQNP